MKRTTLKILLSGTLILSSGVTLAEIKARPLFETIDPPVPVNIPPGKILVQELFWFGCPDGFVAQITATRSDMLRR